MDNQKISWSIIAHGGAKDIIFEDEATNRQGMVKAIAIGSAILSKGGSAIDAVEAVVNYLELDPAYNAGLYGCVRDVEGNINMDAAIMDGKTLAIGSVAHLQHIKHPISVARALLNDRANLLVSEGAGRFAEARGFERQTDAQPQPEGAPGCDTVGCVAFDQHGSLAAGTSTGGLNGGRVGRGGDVPLPGCGFYADNSLGAISASGDGEMIARTLLGIRYLHLVEQMTPNAAMQLALSAVAKIHGEAGLIAIHSDGTIHWDHNSPHFTVGMADDHQPQARIYLRKDEDHA